MKVSISILLLMLFFNGCLGSIDNAYAVKTLEHGQCRQLQTGEKIFYKKRLVSYNCEDEYVLISKPYPKENNWYFKAGHYAGSKVENISSTKVIKSFHKVCQLEGAYGTGNKDIRRFYYDKKFLSCKPFSWSGENGIAPFNSKDECRVMCFHLK